MSGGGDTSLARLGLLLKRQRLAKRAAVGQAALARRRVALAVAQGAAGGGSAGVSVSSHGSQSSGDGCLGVGTDGVPLAPVAVVAGGACGAEEDSVIVTSAAEVLLAMGVVLVQ